MADTLDMADTSAQPGSMARGIPPDGHSSGHGGSPAAAGGGGGGGGHTNPALAAMFALRQARNERAAVHFAAAVCGIMAVFSLLHWTRRLARLRRRPPGAAAGPAVLSLVSRPVKAVSRCLRRLLVRSAAPGLVSSGHGLLVALYVAINLVLLLTNVDRSSLGNMASRIGWMLTANLCFVVFLALKNTPLAFLTAYSYERLNGLHQIAGCTTAVLVAAHGASYASFFVQRGTAATVLRERAQLAGIVAGVLFLAMAASGLLLRRRAYELFYVVHVAAFCVAVVCVGLHRPALHARTPVVVALTAALFLADRLLRLGRLLCNAANNTATVHPLPNGGTRIRLAKRPRRAAPGKHVFLWIPRIRALETHPFTIVSVRASGSTEFVVQSYNGFTRRLHAYATAHPGATLRAAAEGPYGTFPDPMDFETVVLVAGGSGASFTLGLAVSLLERMDAESTKAIVVVWAAKTEETLAWYAEHLATLQTHPHAPKVRVSLYVTRAGASLSAAPLDDGRTSDGDGDAKRATTPAEQSLQLDSDAEAAAAAFADARLDSEKAVAVAAVQQQATAGGRRGVVLAGRPDAASVIREAVSATATAPSQRVLVAACGPPALMTAVRDATAACITSDGPSVELHCEQFGW